MAKRNKANANRNIDDVSLKCAEHPRVEFKNAFGQKKEGKVLFCEMGLDHIIKVVIQPDREKYPHHVSINKVKDW